MSDSCPEVIEDELLVVDDCLFCGKKPEFETITKGKLVMFVHECGVVRYRVSPFRDASNATIRTWNNLMGQARQRALDHFKQSA